MNNKLQSALTELKRAGAKGTPSASSVEKAKDGSSWRGTKKDGSPWSLTKNNESSYSCSC